MKELIRNSRQLRDKLYPSVAVYRIRSEEDYRAVIRYMFKPIPIELPYEYAASSLGYETTQMRRLNQDVNLFLEGLRFVWHEIPRIERHGICSASSSVYAGTVTPERKEKRQAAREYRKKRKAEDRAIRRRFPDYQPYRRTRSREQRELLSLIRILFRRMLEDDDVPKERIQGLIQQLRRRTRRRRG
jgi:hypothetical protein